jgi:hypothetical protein
VGIVVDDLAAATAFLDDVDAVVAGLRAHGRADPADEA